MYAFQLALCSLFLSVLSAGGAVIFNEVYYSVESGVAGDANGDGTRDGFADEFIEIVNTCPTVQDISGWSLGDDDTASDFVFPLGTNLQPGQAAVLFGGGIPTGAFGTALVFTDDGRIGNGLANAGDIIELRDAMGALQLSLAYGSATGSVGSASNQSLTRSPDLTGAFSGHTSATGSGSADYSPGTEIDGTPFLLVPEPSVGVLGLLGLLAVVKRRR